MKRIKRVQLSQNSQRRQSCVAQARLDIYFFARFVCIVGCPTFGNTHFCTKITILCKVPKLPLYTIFSQIDFVTLTQLAKVAKILPLNLCSGTHIQTVSTHSPTHLPPPPLPNSFATLPFRWMPCNFHPSPTPPNSQPLSSRSKVSPHPPPTIRTPLLPIHPLMHTPSNCPPGWPGVKLLSFPLSLAFSHSAGKRELLQKLTSLTRHRI